jgi:hypothetical protein
MEFEQQIRKKYRFIVIRSPHELMENEFVRNLFPKVIQLKVEGYRKEYGNYVLPFDSSDFIATHLVLCELQKDGSYIPVLGFKSVTLQMCDDYRIPFPILSMLENDNNKKTILGTMDGYRATNSQSQLAYNGSFTILPRLRENKVLMKYLWKITSSLLVNYYIEYQIPHVLALCVTKFHIHLKKQELGWNFIQSENGILGPYNCKAFFDTTLVPMEFSNLSIKGIEAAARFKDMWLNRITLDLENITIRRKVA